MLAGAAELLSVVILVYSAYYSRDFYTLHDHLCGLSWLVGWLLRHINLCQLFSAKSIFIQIISSV